MPKFLGITSRGLLEPLGDELKELKVRNVRVRPDAVEFESSWADLYRLHMYSKIASRFLLPVSDFTAYHEDDLYFGVLRKHDFTQYISVDQTMRVEAHVREHKTLHDQRFVMMKIKDALADQFMAKFDRRPDVGDDQSADLRVVARIVGTNVSLALDLTGETLSTRGYRQVAGLAPLRESVAAGLLRLSGWRGPQPLVDPFCGSGTILIEAALSLAGPMKSARPGRFAFEHLKNFKPEILSQLRSEIVHLAPPAEPFLFGYDKDESVLDKARANARLAGVEDWIHFEKCDARELKSPKVEPGLIITNPPYGERLDDLTDVKALMGDFSHTLKVSFKGWSAWVLSGNPEASAALRLKAVRKAPVWNGPIECRFLNYPLH